MNSMSKFQQVLYANGNGEYGMTERSLEVRVGGGGGAEK